MPEPRLTHADLEDEGPETAGPAYFSEEELQGIAAGACDGAVRTFLQLEGAELEAALWGARTGLPPAQCRSCGCTDAQPCPGGCLWANPQATLCSRCVLAGGAR
jgi:hypothetical protein